MSKPKRDSSIEVPDEILKQILTLSESRMLKNRWRIIQLVKEGLSIRVIATEVKVGTDTVVRVARMLEKSNLRKILDGNEEKKQIKTQTPWIFGKK